VTGVQTCALPISDFRILTYQTLLFAKISSAIGLGLIIFHPTRQIGVLLLFFNLGFWLKEANGENDMTTRQAVMAFQKYRGLKVTGGVDAETAHALSEPQGSAKGRTKKGDVVEVDLERQLAFVIEAGITTMTLNVSTGHGGEYTARSKKNPNIVMEDVAETPTGKYHVWRVRPDGWWDGDYGSIYRPIYFKGGIAFHCSAVVPSYPASHGCVRVSVDAMDKLWDMNVLPLHARVHVY
jgi:lipoprotein-anchoring transpeptidase ErfK/SrfK